MDEIDETTYDFLYEIWYSFAEELFNRIVQEIDLDPERVSALRQIVLRPNDFIIQMV